MVKLDKPAKDYTIRVANVGLNQKVFASATLSYKGSNGQNTPNALINYAGQNTTANVRFLNDKTVVPFPAVKPAQTADQTFKLLLNRMVMVAHWEQIVQPSL